MIDFRYHLVSIIAVFLALAVGIVAGTAALNGPISDDLNGSITRLSEDKRVLEGDVELLRSELDAADSFAVAVAPRLLTGTLADRRVLLVTTPETPADLAHRLVPLLTTAGATVTGTLQLHPDLSAPSSGALVEDLVAQVVPAGVELPDGEPVERATAELAAALVRPLEGDAVDAGEAQTVVSAFEEAGLISFEPTGASLEQAGLAVVLTGSPGDEVADAGSDVAQSRAASDRALLGLVRELDARSDGAVAAGPLGSGGEQGLLQLLRSDPVLAQQVSSVDNADRSAGLVTVVLALAQEQAGRTGQYGAASAALPGLAPS